jgi:hypothetical protein
MLFCWCRVVLCAVFACSLGLRPKNKSVCLALAEMCLRGKQYTDAVQYVQRVLQWDPSCAVSKGLLRSIYLGHAMEQSSVNDAHGAIHSYKQVWRATMPPYSRSTQPQSFCVVHACVGPPLTCPVFPCRVVIAWERAQVLALLPAPSESGEVSDELAGAAVQRAEVGFLLGGLYECIGATSSALEWYRYGIAAAAAAAAAAHCMPLMNACQSS